MLKLARRARGHFVTLIEIRVPIIRVKPGHIPSFCKFNTFKVAYYSFPKKKIKNKTQTAVIKVPVPSSTLLYINSFF